MIGQRLLVAGLLVSWAFSSVGHSATPTGGPSTQDLLIQKLSQVQVSLAPADPARAGVSLRLADLLSERARKAAMDDLAKGCTVCEEGRGDRENALRLYKEVLPTLKDNERGKVLMQVARLQEFLGKETDAISTYQTILKEKISSEATSEAHLSLGEIYFKRRQHTLARQEYDQVLAQPGTVSKGLAAYRRAWSLLNEGQLQAAIQGLIDLLKTPAHLNRQASQLQTGTVDKQFQEEVSRDLATFMSRAPITDASIQLLFDLSPDSARLEHLMYLANELERLGQADSSVRVWRFAQQRQSRPEARLQGMIHLSQLEMSLGRRNESIQEFEKAVQLWGQLGGCGGTNCKELHARLRLFVTDWSRAEKKEPSAELLKAYQDYLAVFPEADMRIWAAQIARERQAWQVADAMLAQAVVDLDKELKTPGIEAKIKSDKQTLLESALLSAIEVGELSKNEQILDGAYERYLQLSRDQKRALEVRYQRAYKLYQKADYLTAAEALKQVALLKVPGDRAVRVRAADYALDALVLAKQDGLLEAWSQELTGVFPEKSKDYKAIARKAVLTQSAKLAEQDMAAAWTTLSRFDVREAAAEERVTFYKNRLILAEKMKKFSEAREAAKQLLAQEKLSEADRQFALTRQSWLAEMALDFEGALKATEHIQSADLAGGQKWLQMALFADLAQKDAKPYYAQYLKETKDAEAARSVAARLVRESATPLKEIDTQKARLQGDSDLLARLYLEAFAKDASGKTGAEILKRVLNAKDLAATPSGRFLARYQLLQEYRPLKAKLAAHKIESQNQRSLANSMKTRAKLLTQAETLAQKAVQSQDWTSQLVTLDLVAREADRFYQEILSLPLPAGLSPEEEQQYLGLLSQQAAPYQLKSQDVGNKLAEFWSQESAIQAMGEELKVANSHLKKLWLAEIETIREIAPEASKAKLAALVDTPTNSAAPAVATLPSGRPTLVELEAARREVRENPLNVAALQGLLSLEEKSGNTNMVSYLKVRIEKIEKGAKQ